MFRRPRENEDDIRNFGEAVGYGLRQTYLAYKGVQSLASFLPEMSPPAKKKNARRRLRGPAASSAELAGPQGRGPTVPNPGLGNDTLLGIARSIRRILPRAAHGALDTGGTGAYAETTFVLNDPYNSGTSATGFSKYMAFYSKCFVVGATIVVKSVVNHPGTNFGVWHGLTVTTNNTAFTSLEGAIVNGMCDWRAGYTNPDRFHLMQGVDTKRFLNKPFVLDDPQLYCTSSAGPTQVITAHFGVQALGTTAAAINNEYVAEIYYDCVFTDPIPFT